MTRAANVPHVAGSPQAHVEYLVGRIRSLEDEVAKLKREHRPMPPEPPLPPLPYSWSGPVSDLVDIASSPGLFSEPGVIYRIDYRFTVAAPVTVEWKLDGAVIFTHTVASNTFEIVDQPYDGDDIVATVTADSGAEGLTAFVFLR